MKNDFTVEKWKTGALKNAFALLGKQKFELAAAFFLLGGQLKDAVGVCLQKLQDFQLALVLSRLVEGEGGPSDLFVIMLCSFSISLQGNTVKARIGTCSCNKR